MFHPDVLAKIIKNECTKPVQLTHRIFREKKMEFSPLSLIMPFIHIYYNVKLSLFWEDIKTLFSIMQFSFWHANYV